MRNNEEKLYVSKNKANSNNMNQCLHTQKKWPWQERFVKFLTILSDFGFPKQWSLEFSGLDKMGDKKDLSKNFLTKLKLTHFYSGFGILIIGLTISFFSFVVFEFQFEFETYFLHFKHFINTCYCRTASFLNILNTLCTSNIIDILEVIKRKWRRGKTSINFGKMRKIQD